MELSELPKASSRKLNKVAPCLHVAFRNAQLSFLERDASCRLTGVPHLYVGGTFCVFEDWVHLGSCSVSTRKGLVWETYLMGNTVASQCWVSLSMIG